MTVKKGCLLAAFGGVVLVGLIVALVFWLTGGAVKSAEDFLSQLARGEVESAYQSASAEFKAQTDLESFQAFVQQTGLTRYASASWSSRRVENNQAELEGSIETTDGGTVPLTITLVKEDGSWKILSISGPEAGVVTTGAARPLPADAELKQLASRTLVDFESAITRRDFTAFHASVSNLWKTQITPEGLLSVFEPMLDGKVDLGASGGEPTFSQAPSIDSDGVLHLNGYLAATAAPSLKFTLKYLYEHPNWKLFGIHVSIQTGETEAEESTLGEPEQPGGEPVESEPQGVSDSSPPSSGSGWVIEDNPELSGRVGRCLVRFPADADVAGAKISVYRAGESEAAVTAYGALEADLLPGRYYLEISGQRVTGVEVASARDTRLLVGVLRVRVGSSTKVVIHGWLPSQSQSAPIATAYGNHDFGLPVGTYQVEIAGQKEPATVENDRITEF